MTPTIRAHRARRAATATAAVIATAALALSATPGAAAERTLDLRPHGPQPTTASSAVTKVSHPETRGDRLVMGTEEAQRNAAHRPGSIDMRRVTYTLNEKANTFTWRVKGTNFTKVRTKNGHRSIQYVDLNVWYELPTKGGDTKLVRAFGFDTWSANAKRGETWVADREVTDECRESVDEAKVTMSFRKDLARATVSLDCLPVDTVIHVEGAASLWVTSPAGQEDMVAMDSLSDATVLTRTS